MRGNSEPIFPIGLRCVQDALIRAGHDAVLVDFLESPELLDNLSWLADDFDVVAFTIRNIDPIDLSCGTHVDDYIAFAARVRSEHEKRGREPLLVGGGPGFSLFPNELTALMRLDVGVSGPGEEVMLQLAGAPRSYRGTGAVLQGRRHVGFLTSLLSHPPSLMAAYTARPGAMIGVETRRKTCYQGCVYCPYAHIAGDNSGDLKPLSVLQQEIEGIYAAGFRRIFFTDGIFNSELPIAKDVVRLLHQLQLPDLQWSAYFTPKPFDDEFADLLIGSNVDAVVVSPDSLDDEVMRALGKSFDRRHVLRFLERSRVRELPVKVNVVFGGPGESRESVARSVAFINEHLLDDELVLHVGYRVLPGTALAADIGLPAQDLLYPVYLPFDVDVFRWLVQDLDNRFLTPSLTLNLMAGRAVAMRSAKAAKRTVEAGGRSSLLLEAGPRRT